MHRFGIHKALSSPTRREIMLFLGEGKKFLTEIAEHANKTPQTIDFHLNILINSGLVESIEEDGKRFYVLKDRSVMRFLEKEMPLPPHLHPKPPHEIVLDIRDELNERMDKIEKKIDKILKKI